MEQSRGELSFAVRVLKALNAASDLSLTVSKLAEICHLDSVSLERVVMTVNKIDPGLIGVGNEVFLLKHRLDFLDEEYIYQKIHGRGRVEVCDCLGSTNTTMLSNTKVVSKGDALFAELQFAGRGRRGGRWDAGIGANITLSVAWYFKDVIALAGLSCAMGVSVCEALQRFTKVPLSIKWPNDIYATSGKLGGILIESKQLEKDVMVVIGIGINVQGVTAIDENGYERAALLDTVRQGVRNEVAISLVDAIRTCCKEYEKKGLEPFIEPFSKRDRLKAHFLRINDGGRIYEGLGEGIDLMGRLLLSKDGNLIQVAAGHVESFD